MLKMRQIKFRGRRINNMEWVYGFYYEAEYCDGKGIQSFIKMDVLSGVPVYPETVGQFIGILDKKGIEIYEKDKIKTESGIFEVFYNERFSCFECRFTGNSVGFYKDIEVVKSDLA